MEAVLALPAKYRTAVHLYYYEELSVAEIAAVLGKSEGGQVPAVPGQGAAAAVFEGGRRCFRTTIGGRWTG
ncbi:MAG: sigma factor-like helix-turn-helix DNA-binding protein [Flavonifractor plautii]